jgi:hypothetical protein
MSPIRRLAVRILGVVVRWASPGCKEWAEGLAREVEFIGGDWRALGWALGSVRVVLDPRATAARRGDRPWPLLWWAWPFFESIQILSNSVDALRASNWHDRIASSLIAFGWMGWATYSVTDWLWRRNEPPISDIHAYRLFSRATLERRLGRYRSLRRWLPLVVPVSMCTGFVMSLEAGGELGRISTGFVIAVALVAVWMLCLDTPAKIETRLARVNERLAESANGGDR